MIVRIFRVQVRDGKRDEFEKFFRETAIPLVNSQPGIVSVTAGVPLEADGDEFCMVMVWKDVESLKAFAGEDWRKPHIDPAEAKLVKERFLNHYQLAS